MKGKRYILLCTLYSVLCTLPLLAQPRLRTPEFYLGVHGGVSASTVMFTPAVANMTPITNACVLGGNGGLVFRYAGHKYCHFQAEVNYVHRGWAEKSTEGSYARSLHYIEVPILMNLNFGKKVCRWFFNLGPQVGYCFRDESMGELIHGSGATEYAALDHKFDWGMVAGTGVYFQTRKAGIYQLELRFDFSFGGIYGTTPIDHYSMANPMDLSINLGWLMPVKKISEEERLRRAEERRKRAEQRKYRIR